jgi:hypothetical protein
MKISLWVSDDNGGSTITNYEIERDDGALGAFTKVADYMGAQEYLFD